MHPQGLLSAGLPRRLIRRVVQESNNYARRLVPKNRALEIGAANSLCTTERLAGLQALSEDVARRGLRGNMVECGVYRGGSAAVIAERLLRGPEVREVWLFDVFAGMPQPGPEDPPQAWEDVGKFVSSAETVRETLSAAKVPINQVRVVVGRFEQTLPSVPTFPIVFLHLDCDWYESVKVCLQKFYDTVVTGAPVVFDDYGYWSGCRKAVDEFMAERSLDLRLTPIDSTSHYFLKPPAT